MGDEGEVEERALLKHEGACVVKMKVVDGGGPGKSCRSNDGKKAFPS